MGSIEVEFLAGDNTDIHVAVDRSGIWWAVGSEGSYGGHRDRTIAIKIARDASATAAHGKRRIVVHRPNDTVDFVITRIRQQGSPQFFQDSVP